MMNGEKVALVTGGSSGIGRAASEALTKRGVTVYELSRRDIPLNGVRHITGDVTKEQDLTSAVNIIVSERGKLDILVCCAGFGISGAVEFTELSAAKKQMEVNFFGVCNTVKAALPHMREKGKGRIILISSVAAEVPIPFQTYYSASKAAINSYAAALRNEVRPYGISVCAVMPGDISTGFTDMREKSPVGDEEYGGRISRSVAVMEKDERGGMAAETAGEFIARAALKKSVPPLMTIGFQYKVVSLVVHLIPSRLTSRLLYEIYAK